LADHVHTDIVSHSTDGFPTQNGQQFLELLRAIAASGPDAPSPKPIEQFLGSHPTALAFVQAPKPFPSSFARETYFGISAFAFTDASGEKRYGRYRILPEEGDDYLSDEQVARIPANYHFEEIVEHVASRPVRFQIRVQVAQQADQTDDATVHWPADRELVDFGTVELTKPVASNLAEQKQIIFDPIPRVEGIEPSADPLFELRAAIYLLSGRRRRQATDGTAG
jgi:catalase